MLHVVGNAGGAFHLRDGLVIGVDSPGAPDAEALLLGSGRISAEDWNAALVDSVEKRSLRAALLEREAIGATEIEVLTLAVIQDGAFAVAAGDIERYFVDESADAPLLSASEGVAAELLLAETARRLDAIASLPFPVSPYRDRVVPTTGAMRSASTSERRDIIAHATGRRTARDMAFVVSRSLYAVTVEISRMLGEELLETAPPETSFGSTRWGLNALRPRSGTGRPARPTEADHML